ncbi:MAG: element excision factor XisH family protein, partial [Bacteroidota bacterium]
MARDKIHLAVKNALVKDGWKVSFDPFCFKSGEVELEVDMAAERIIAASKEGREILVEVKSLDMKSLLYDFHGAIGQYINYRYALEDEFYSHELYLAISE